MRHRPRRRTADEPFFEQLVESAPDAMLVVDAAGVVVFANQRADALTGWPRDELLGQPVEVLVPDAVRSAHPVHRSAYGSDPRPRPMGVGLELRLVVADGTEVPVDISLSPFEHQGRRYVAVAIRDVTDRERAAAALRRAQLDLEQTVAELRRSGELFVRANELGDLLHSCRSLEDAYLVVARHGSRILTGRGGAIYRSSASGGEMDLVRSWGEASSFEEGFLADGCWALRRGRLHVHGDDDDLPCRHLEAGCRSACVPLLAHGEVLGLLVVLLGPDGPVPDDLEQRARTVGDHLALALANIELRETLRAQSIRDPLTGLYNRRYLDEHLPREVHRSDRTAAPIALLSIDLDHFKEYNDEHGHGAGDTALLSVASMIRLRCRDEDIVCRLGGEEFLVVMPGANGDEAGVRAEALRRACSELPFGAGRSLTMSVGVASYPEDGASIELVLEAVDEALYAAKRAGRNRVERAAGRAV